MSQPPLRGNKLVVTKYSTESPRDFEQLQAHITMRLKALLQKKEQLGQVAQMSSVSKVEGLEQYDIMDPTNWTTPQAISTIGSHQ
jgi:hypothetical protein